MRLHFFSFLISLLLTSAALAAGHGNDGYPNIRMFLQESGSETGQYRAVCFENATDVGNFYGSTNGNYTLAQEFFASPVPPRTQYCATRFPGILQARAHLWSANVYNSLARIKAASGTLNLAINGGVYTACVGSGTGCFDLSGETNFDTIASDLQCLMRAGPGGATCNGQSVVSGPTPHQGNLIGSVTNYAVNFTAVNAAGSGAWLDVTSTSGTLYPGTQICAASIPCDQNSSDYIGQIVGQYNYLGGTVGGVGAYGLFLPPTNLFTSGSTVVGTYSVLTLGAALTTPFGFIEVGQSLADKTTASSMPPNSNVWYCISNCNQIGPNPMTPGAQYALSAQTKSTLETPTTGTASGGNITLNWSGALSSPPTGTVIVTGNSKPGNNCPTGCTIISSTTTSVTYTPSGTATACSSCGGQISVNQATVNGDTLYSYVPNINITWNQQNGPTKTWGNFYINEGNLSPAVNSSTNYATGTAAYALGLAQNSIGDDSTIPNTDAFNSSEASVYYPSVASLMNSIASTVNGNWQSCQFTQSDAQQPQSASGLTLAMLIDQWAQTTANIQCPGGYNGGPNWMTTPASTPAANAFVPIVNPTTWSISYTPGLLYYDSYDSGAQFAGGTEGRALAALNAGSYITPTDPPTAGQAQLFLGLGYWNDNWGSEGRQNAQIMVLDTPTGTWKVDYNFGDFCPSPSNTTCALAVSYMAPLTWLFDASGAPVNLQTMEAGIWWNGVSDSTTCHQGTPPPQNPVPIFNFTKNTIDNLWYSTLITCSAYLGTGQPQVRSAGIHVDQVVSTAGSGLQYAFAGEVSGIYHGQLKHPQIAGQDMVAWSTGGLNCLTYNTACPAEFYTSQYYSGPSCSHENRTMAFAEAAGSDGVVREYASICYSLFVRIDGPQASCNPDQVYLSGSCHQRWQLYWSAPTYNVNSPSGLRGLTNIGGNLLTGVEGGAPLNYWNVPPLPGCASVSSGVVTVTNTSCATSELNLVTTTNSYTGMTTGDQVDVYNHFIPYATKTGQLNFFANQSTEILSAKVPNGSNQTLVQLYTSNQGADGTQLLGEGLFTTRTPAATYTFTEVPQLFPTPNGGIRDMIASPWTSECPVNNTFPNGGCAFYVTDYDTYTFSQYTWCTSPYSSSSQCPPVTSPTSNVHNMATVIRYGSSTPYNTPVYTPPLAGLQTYPGCAAPTPAPSGTQWYVDWNSGSDSNTGKSAASPLKSLQNLLSGSSKPFAAGDTINVKNGTYGDITLPTTSSTAGFSTIQASAGQVPVLTSLSATNAAKWNITGLKVQNTASGLYQTLVSFANSNNIVLNNLDVSSQANVSSWTQSQWLSTAKFTGVSFSGNSASSCVALINSNIYNVINGIFASAANTLIGYNTINNLGGDFIDIGYNNMSVIGNTMTNSNYLGNGAHNDFVQLFFGGNVNFADFSNILISDNLMIRQTTPTSVAFPWGIQGIDAFIDSWTNLTVTNNVLISSAANGIAIGGDANMLITNNTVLDDQSNVYETLQGGTCCLYIQAGVAYDNVQPASRNVIVRNNVASQFNLSSLGSQGIADHNYTFTAGTSNVFNNFNPTAYQFDVSPASASVLYNAGSPTMTPTTDITGVTRTSTPTIGAYQ